MGSVCNPAIFKLFRRIRKTVRPGVFFLCLFSVTFGPFAPVFAQSLSDSINQQVSIPQLAKPFNGDYEVTRRFGEKIDSEESKVATASAEPVADSTPEVDAAYTSGVSVYPERSRRSSPEVKVPDISSKLADLEGGGGHNGIDFAMPQGTEILAVDDGEITSAGEGDYGITVVIKHSWGESVYGHLSEVANSSTPGVENALTPGVSLGNEPKLQPGDTVSKGYVIGTSGSTGLATGPHLHFGIKNSNGEFVDPALYLGLSTPEESIRPPSGVKTQNTNTSEVGFDSSEVERDTASQILGESSSANLTFEDVSNDPNYLYNYKFNLLNGTSVHFDHKTDPRPGYAIADSGYNYKLRFFLKEAVNSAQNTSEAAQSDSSDGGQRGPTVKDNIVEFPITLLSKQSTPEESGPTSEVSNTSASQNTSEVRIPAALRYTIYDNRVKEDIILLEKPAIDSTPQNTSEASFGSSEVDSDNLISFEVQSAGLEVVNTSTSEESIRPPSEVKTQNTNTVDKNSQYIFKNPDGSVYWQIQKPTLEDANGKTGEILGILTSTGSSSSVIPHLMRDPVLDSGSGTGMTNGGTGMTNGGTGMTYVLSITSDFLKSAQYPVTIDPSVVLSGGFTEAEAQHSNQRKIAYASSNWYAFYYDGTTLYYKKSSDGSSWGDAVTLDSSNSPFAPTAWVEGTTIYVAWLRDTGDTINVNSINTASSDAFGTQCTSSDLGTFSTANASDWLAMGVADNGTIYAANGASITAVVMKLAFSGCTFTDITTSSGLTTSDRPTATTMGNNFHLIFQDGNLSHSVYDGSSWTTSNTTIATDTEFRCSVTTDATNLWVIAIDALYKFDGSTWSSLTAPWTSETNFTSASITYDSTNSDLYAFAIHDTSEQGYWKSSDASTISWSSETSLSFTAGDLGHISSPESGAGRSQIAAVLRQGSNFEFASLNQTPDAPSSLGGHVSGAFTADTTPTLTFTLADSDSGDTVKYQIQIDDSSNFGSAVVDYTSALAAQGSTSFTVGQAAGSGSYTTGSAGQTLSDGDYYWRVKAIDNSSAESSYSTANSGSIAFKVDAAAPTTPGTPSTTTPTTDTTPTWTWTASTDSGAGLATTPYTLQWSTDSSFGSGVSSTTSSTASFTHSTALADGTWYLRIKAKDTLDNESSYSSSGSVVIDTTAPGTPELDSPADKAYVSNPRPAFRWKAASGIDSYKLEIDNGDTGDITIDGISPSRTTDVETSRYLIRYENFSDSDSNNNYIAIYTKTSTLWSSSQDDGKLKEGKRSWQITASDTVGNTGSSSRTLYADYTGPTFDSLKVNSIGQKSGYSIVIDTTPKIEGTISDNFSPEKVKLSVLVENYFLGVLISTTSVSEQTIDLKNTANSTKLDFSMVSEALDWGKYQIIARGTDKAGNSREETLNIEVLTEEAARKLLRGEDEKLKEESKVSLPELEKKAKLRREMEASELHKFLNQLKEALAPPMHAIAQAFNKTKEHLAQILPNQIASLKTALLAKYSTVKYLVNTSLAQAQNVADKLNLAADDLLKNSEENVKAKAIAAQKETQAEAQKIAANIQKALSQTTSGLTQSQDTAARRIRKTHGDTSTRLRNVYGAADLAFQSLKKPLDETGDFLHRVKVGAYTFHAIVFDKEPTRIRDVTIVEIGPDYAVISWNTNHFATGKVNWGEDLKYGNEIILDNRERYHQTRLTGLKAGTRYFFEVMSQNKNYAYDAFYSFETEDK